ncbi:MAG: hypothetical protein LBK47_02140 [Prevotellaceae bacterium]|jgi:hypothetical protein|nr:hypothetical protein [Prevotellaceae bacterium]
MNKCILLLFLLYTATISVAQSNNTHIIKANSKINALFKGEGFVFESLGYEYILNMKHSVGFRIGWDFKTSKMEVPEVGKAITHRNLLLALEHYYFPYKNQRNSGMYISPELYYANGMLSVDNEKSHEYGLNLSLGYRCCFNPIVLDCALFSGYGYSYQENNVYAYRSKEIKSLEFKVTIGFIL